MKELSTVYFPKPSILDNGDSHQKQQNSRNGMLNSDKHWEGK